MYRVYLAVAKILVDESAAISDLNESALPVRCNAIIQTITQPCFGIQRCASARAVL